MHPTSQDISAYIKHALGIAPQAPAASTVNGTSFDRLTAGLANFGSVMISALTGASTGTPTTISAIFKLQHSDDNSAWTDFGTSTVTITAINTAAKLGLDITGAKRYIRTVCTVSFTGGSSPTILISAGLELGGGDHLPQ